MNRAPGEGRRSVNGYRIPVAVLVAERDSIIPARFGRHLYQQLGAPKRLWQVPGAEHNDWLGYVDEGWWAEMAEHLLPVLRPGGGR